MLEYMFTLCLFTKGPCKFFIYGPIFKVLRDGYETGLPNDISILVYLNNLKVDIDISSNIK